MSAKHTPGPWRAQRVRGSDGYLIAEVGGSVVAETSDWLILAKPEDHAPTGMVPPDQDEADARLIAAAPEMLETLKQARAALSAMTIATVGTDEHSAPIKAIDAAIAKAEGST